MVSFLTPKDSATSSAVRVAKSYRCQWSKASSSAAICSAPSFRTTVTLRSGAVTASSGDWPGERARDLIQAHRGDDKIAGGPGDDLIAGNSGNDSIRAGDDDDVVHSGTGNDVVAGGAGNDELSATFRALRPSGNDRFFGGLGDDTIFNQTGDDLLHGGRGRDTVRVRQPGHAIRVDLAAFVMYGRGADAVSAVENIVWH
ncbi:MAG: hypothetical protein H0U21_01535 [Acidimicrobiia bacterium]|nr:hypothetical protein [Acidimicrobiia bacterium]